MNLANTEEFVFLELKSQRARFRFRGLQGLRVGYGKTFEISSGPVSMKLHEGNKHTELYLP